jgi:hypothetical protein
LLRLMSHPVDGLVAQRDFTPSIASVKAWLDEHSGPKVKPPEQRLLEEPDRVPPTPEEQERVAKRVLEARRVLNETLDSMRKSGKITGRVPKPKQVDDEALRMEAMECLEAMNRMGESEDDLSV